MTRKRRILFLHLGHNFGGVEVYLGNLAKLLREDAEVVALCSHPELIERLQAQSVQVLKFPELAGPLRGMRFLLAAVLLPFVVWKHRIDTVHINGHWESILLGPALCSVAARSQPATRPGIFPSNTGGTSPNALSLRWFITPMRDLLTSSSAYRRQWPPRCAVSSRPVRSS